MTFDQFDKVAIVDEHDKGPQLPTATESSENHTQKILVHWLVGYLIQIHAKHYIPDNAINNLLKFLSVFFSISGRFWGFAANIKTIFPPTMYKLRKILPNANEFNNINLSQVLQNLSVF